MTTLQAIDSIDVEAEMKLRGLGILLTVAAMGVALVPSAAADSGRGRESEVKVVQVQDDCDPATFNVALGPGACVGNGDTTFDSLIAQLVSEGGADKWRFHPDEFTIRRGDSLLIKNVGGEFHTFTPVAQFGGGCVDQLNAILGLTPVPECVTRGFVDALPAGGALAVPAAATAHQKYQCMVHPWMHALVTVRSGS